MAIETNKPITIPDAPFVAFPNIQIMWPDLNRPVVGRYSLIRYSTDEYGHNTVAPTKPITDTIPDLFAEAASEQALGFTDLAQGMSLILAYLARRETRKGNI